MLTTCRYYNYYFNCSIIQQFIYLNSTDMTEVYLHVKVKLNVVMANSPETLKCDANAAAFSFDIKP